MQSHENRIALRAIRAVLDAAEPFHLTVEGTPIDVQVQRTPSAPWPEGGLEGLDEALDGPLPRGVEATCSWRGGRATLVITTEWWKDGSYRHLVGLRVAVAGRQEINWTTVALALRGKADGDVARVSALFSPFKRQGEDAEGAADRKVRLRGVVERSGLPLATPAYVEIFGVTVPSGDVTPSPKAGFERLIHLALIKLPFVLRDQRLIHGRPPFEAGAPGSYMEEVEDEAERPAGVKEGRRSGLYPLPGGVREYKATLDALLEKLQEGPLSEAELLELLRERYGVTGEVSVGGYTLLLTSLGLAQLADGCLTLTASGEEYLKAPEPEALFDSLHRSFTGILEVLVITGRLGRATTAQCQELLLPLLGCAWKTKNQTAFRRNWLLSCGITARQDDADTLTPLGRRLLADHEDEAAPLRARVEDIARERAVTLPSPEDLARMEGDTSDPGLEEEDSDAELITQPFDPTKIRIETRTMTVDLLISRIKAGEIDLSPDFQRTAGLWRDGAQSRLIESLLIRVPVPAFYMDATDDERWLVVDGLQRLTVLRRFVIDEGLALTELEFLKDLTGKRFSGLPRHMQRRVLETQVTVNLIQPGTPSDVKFNIFKRINTGGLPLSPQEIRHALNQGPAAALLQALAALPEFDLVAGASLRDQRMTDRECVLRFLAFILTPYSEYRSPNLDGFLNDQMKRLNAMSDDERAALRGRFSRAMRAAHRVFGGDAFRKRYAKADHRKPINKALFECWSVTLDALSDDDLALLVERRERLREAFIGLMSGREFDAAISQGTGDIRKVQLRFGEVMRIARETVS